MRVVSDTGPLHYLVLIERIDLLRLIFGGVVVPSVVVAELTHAKTPAPVKDWVAAAPDWFHVATAPLPDVAAAFLSPLDSGERAAIALAVKMQANLLLMDDRAGVAVARAAGIDAIGTLGVLDLAARRGIVDIGDAIERLKSTNFRYRPALLDSLVRRHRGNDPA